MCVFYSVCCMWPEKNLKREKGKKLRHADVRVLFILFFFVPKKRTKNHNSHRYLQLRCILLYAIIKRQTFHRYTCFTALKSAITISKNIYLYILLRCWFKYKLILHLICGPEKDHFMRIRKNYITKRLNRRSRTACGPVASVHTRRPWQ